MILNWYEIWVDESPSIPYVLMLLCIGSEELFQIYDPVERTILYAVADYESAKFWLLEDEYIKVDGKMVIDRY